MSKTQKRIRSFNASGFLGRGLAVGKSFEGFAPKDPLLERAGFLCSIGKFSSFSRVARGKGREQCQDLSFVLTDGDYMLAGALDGYGKLGDDLPEELAICMHTLWTLRKLHIEDTDAAALFLYDAAELALGNLRKRSSAVEEIAVEEEMDDQDETPTYTEPGNRVSLPYGGSTVALAFVLPGGRYFAVGVGDAAFYEVGAGKRIRRLFEYNRVYHGFYDQETNFADSQITARHYSIWRHAVSTAINEWHGIGINDIETAEGRLKKGDRIILASDGITKNLKVNVDSKGNVVEAGGCGDIRDIIGRKRNVLSIGEAIFGEVKERMRLDTENYTVIELPDNKLLLPANDDTVLVVISME